MTDIKKNWAVIRCPHCGYELIPSEIFYPNDLTGGRPESLIRDALGKIIYLEYEEDNEPLQSEQYICDSCDKPFVVEPVVSYKTKKEIEELDFSNDTVSLL